MHVYSAPACLHYRQCDSVVLLVNQRQSRVRRQDCLSVLFLFHYRYERVLRLAHYNKRLSFLPFLLLTYTTTGGCPFFDLLI